MENQTTVTEFILLGVSNDSCLQMPLFLVFFVIYLITLVENMLVVLVIKADPHLHTPMYFLSNLSFLDIYYSSVTVPKMLENFLAEWKTISLSGCIAQIVFFIFMFGTEIFLLSAMAYDQYASIFNSTTMSQHVGVQMVLGDWVSGFLDSLVNTLYLTGLSFCGPHEINHFSCELLLLLQLSCTDTFAKEMVILCFIRLCLSPPHPDLIHSYPLHHPQD